MEPHSVVLFFFIPFHIPFYDEGDPSGTQVTPGPFATHAARVLLRAKGQPRAMSRALSCRWQHAAIHLSRPHIPRRTRAPRRRHTRRLCPRSRESASPRLVSPCLYLSLSRLVRFASPRLATVPPVPRRARKQRVFAACALLRGGLPSPLFRAHACTYFFVNLIAPTRGFLLPRFFARPYTVYAYLALPDTRRDRYYSKYFYSF